jgi:hypothetical protein
MSPPPPTEVQNRRRALSRWDNEGGALAQSAPDVVAAASRELTNTELVHLRIRVIALENLMIAVLARDQSSSARWRAIWPLSLHFGQVIPSIR